MSALVDFMKLRRIFVSSAILSITFALTVTNNLVDQFYVTLNGMEAAHAYTLDVPITWIMASAATALSAVYSRDVRRELVRGHMRNAERVAVRALIYSVIFGFIVALILAASIIPLFWIITEPGTGDAAVMYLTPQLCLFFCMSISCMLGGFLNAEGKTKLYTMSLIASVLTNIALGHIFVVVMDMGMTGNGLATALGSAVTMLVLLGYYITGRTAVHLHMRRFSWSFEAVKVAFARIWPTMSRLLVRYIAELIIRFSLFMTYALTYGIPMLFSALIAAFGAGAGTYLAAEYNKAYKEKRYEDSKRIFVISIIIGGGTLFLMSTMLYIFAEPIAGIFTIDSSLEESRDTLIWTMRVLCFTAPFLGLNSIIQAVWSPVGKKERGVFVDIVIQTIKVSSILYAISIAEDFTMAVYLLLAFRVTSTALNAIFAVKGLRRRYKPHCAETATA